MSAFAWQAVGAGISELLFVVACALLFALPVLLLLVLLYRPSRQEAFESAVILVTVAAIGIVVGDLGGLSRTSVVGEVVPALLTVIGGFSVYLFGLKRAESRITNLAAVLFVLSFFFGYTYSAILRTDDEAFEFCRSKYSAVDMLSNTDALKQFNALFSAYCGDLIARHTSVPTK